VPQHRAREVSVSGQTGLARVAVSNRIVREALPHVSKVLSLPRTGSVTRAAVLLSHFDNPKKKGAIQGTESTLKVTTFIIILAITFVQGIYNYVTKTNHGSRVYVI